MGALCLFDNAVASFRAHLLARDAARNTVAAYTRDVVQLGRILNAGGGTFDLAALDLAHLRAWLKELDRLGIRPVSRARKVAAVRAFCSHLARSGALSSNPALALVLPRCSRPLPEVLGPDEAKELVELPPGRTALSLRDRAILELLYGCGLRVSELAALDLDDVRGRSLRIAGRTSARLVPLGAPAWSAVRRYLRRRSDFGVDTSALFLGRRGRRIGVRRVQAIVARRGREVGRGRAVHPSALRDSCAAHLLDGGADLFTVARVLGHASAATTTRYEAVAIAGLTAIYQATHPLARRRLTTGREPR